MQKPAQPRRRGEETRRSILVVAEELFANRGFSSTRLEDIAERVGIRRASIVYYFRDKAQLYEAVNERLFTDLSGVFSIALVSSRPAWERVEGVLSAWVEFVGGRPTVARMILRQIADSLPATASPTLAYTSPLLDIWTDLIREGQKQGVFGPVDPIHLAITLAGATVFFVGVTPLLGPTWALDPSSRDRLDAHLDEMLRVARRLLSKDTSEPVA